MRSYKEFYAICNKNGFTKEEVVLQFTDQRTNSLTALNDDEFRRLMVWMQQFNKIPPGNEIRRKMFMITKQMYAGKTNKELAQILDGWCRKQKYKKPLMLHNVAELGVICTIYEDKVLGDFLTNLNK
ncbi:hypothetical protein ACFS5N_16375 [Mucilaginibacter ximonensis]|uniref:DUF1018 domain-containing protein n=1 Tax=Mucilaginibacter ximonensis TaxID=538021 RepID=A0ABW5YFJ0_9SPHI